jgi:hypothetical protein
MADRVLALHLLEKRPASEVAAILRTHGPDKGGPK